MDAMDARRGRASCRPAGDRLDCDPREDTDMTQTAQPAQSLDDMLRTHVARFTERRADWDAFADARVEGFKRAQHRFIGSGASGKADASVIPAHHFTLSVMFIPPGQGNSPHTHEVEEVFFILQGTLSVFVEDESGRRVSRTLGPWECISCPPGVIHGYQNESPEPVYFQVMLGRAKPETMGYADDLLYQRRDAHLKM